MHYHWDFGFLLRYVPLFWSGILVTLAYTFSSIVIGLVIGLLVGLGRLSKSRLLNLPLIAYIEAFRCTPLLVQLVWFYYALPVLLGIQIPAMAAAVMTLSAYTGAFYAEIFRGGIISIEQGQWDAARALGLRPSLVSTIAVPDLLYNGTLITADTYRPLEVYTVVALVYFALLFPSTLLAQAYERSLAKGR